MQTRQAKFSYFSLADEVIDSGISLFFPKPNSFTGEDVVEIQAHGSPVTLKRIIRECLKLVGPLRRIMPTPDLPGAVASATIVSVRLRSTKGSS